MSERERQRERQREREREDGAKREGLRSDAESPQTQSTPVGERGGEGPGQKVGFLGGGGETTPDYQHASCFHYSKRGGAIQMTSRTRVDPLYARINAQIKQKSRQFAKLFNH